MRPADIAPSPVQLVALVVLLAAASCASVAPHPMPVAPASAAGAGTILAVRPIVAPGAAATDTGMWRAVLLDGATDSGDAAQSTGVALAEIIVHEDTGATISIVQSNTAGLHAGDRVTIGHPAASAGRASLARLL